MELDESLWAEPPEQKSVQYGPEDLWYVKNPRTGEITFMCSDRLTKRIANNIIEDCKPMASEAGLSIRSFMRRTLISIADKVG